MAGFVFPKAAQKFSIGQLDVTDGTLKVVLLTSTYEIDPATEFLSGIPDADRVGTATVIADVTSVSDDSIGTVINGDGVIMAAVASGLACDRVLIFSDSGDPATSPVVAVVQLGDPVTPVGNDVDITWSDSPAAIIVFENVV